MEYQAYELETVLKLNVVVDVIGGYNTSLTVAPETKALIKKASEMIVNTIDGNPSHHSHKMYDSLGHIKNLALQLEEYTRSDKFDIASNKLRALIINIEADHTKVTNYLKLCVRYGWKLPRGLSHG